MKGKGPEHVSVDFLQQVTRGSDGSWASLLLNWASAVLVGETLVSQAPHISHKLTECRAHFYTGDTACYNGFQCRRHRLMFRVVPRPVPGMHQCNNSLKPAAVFSLFINCRLTELDQQLKNRNQEISESGWNSRVENVLRSSAGLLSFPKFKTSEQCIKVWCQRISCRVRTLRFMIWAKWSNCMKQWIIGTTYET